MGFRIPRALVLPLAVALAWALCVREGFVPFELLWRQEADGIRVTACVDGRKLDPVASGPAGAEIPLDPDLRIPPSAVVLRLTGEALAEATSTARVRINGREIAAFSLAGERRTLRSVSLLPVAASGDLKLEVEHPPGARVSRLEVRNTVASHGGPAGASLLAARGPPRMEGAAPLARAAAAGLGAAGILALYGLLLAAAARRDLVRPAPLLPLLPAATGAAPSLAVLAATLASPWPVAMTGRALLLATAWALAGGVLADLFRRRAAALAAHGTEEEKARFGRRRAALLLSAAAFTAYNVNFASHDQVDAIPCPYAALSLARELDLDLQEFPMLRDVTRPIESVDSPVIERPDRWVSKYPPGGAILSAPVLLLADLAGLVRPESRRAMLFLGKLSASAYVAASVGLLYLALLRLGSPRPGAWAAIYAFGTAALSVSSQSAWQHGFAQCMLAASIWLVLAGPDGARTGLALGAVLSMLVLCRPADALFSAALLLAVLVRRPGRAGWILAGAAPFALLQAAYNRAYFGSVWATGYGPELSRFETPLWTGLAGLAVSPSRGLFVYSPVLLLSFAGIWRAWRTSVPGDGTALLRGLSVACAGFAVVMAKWNAWDGGWCFGNRMLADALPALVLLAAAGAASLQARRWLRPAFSAAAILSISIHALGVLFHNDRWNADPRSSPWSLRGTQIGSYLRYAGEKFAETF